MTQDAAHDPFAAYARFYDLEYAGFDEDLLMVRELAARCGSPLLELGCGSGRLLVPLAREGYRITGVDASEAMLERARRAVADAGVGTRVTLVRQDLRQLALDGEFRLAFAPINTFMHLPDGAAQLETLVRVRQHLRPGGLIVLDLFNPETLDFALARGQVVLDRVLDGPATDRPILLLRSQTADLTRQILDVTVMVDETEASGLVRRTLFRYSLRYLHRAELELLIGQAGLELEAVYGSYDLDDWGADSEKMIAVARRPT